MICLLCPSRTPLPGIVSALSGLCHHLIKCQARAGAVFCEHASGSSEKKFLKLLSGMGGGEARSGKLEETPLWKEAPKPEGMGTGEGQEEAGGLAQE